MGAVQYTAKVCRCSQVQPGALRWWGNPARAALMHDVGENVTKSEGTDVGSHSFPASRAELVLDGAPIRASRNIGFCHISHNPIIKQIRYYDTENRN